jgi:hypothetical protein
MKLLRYKSFIKESKDIDIWMSETEILNLFQSFIDDEYLVDVEKTFSRSDKEISNDVIMKNDENIYIGWSVTMGRSQIRGTEDLTNVFKSVLTELRQNGYNVFIKDNDSEIDENQIKINRGIYIKIDDSGPLKNETKSISIFLIQNESQKLTDKNIAEFHDWSGYESDGDEIYFEMSIEDLAYLMLNRRQHDRGGYIDLLTNGIDRDNYDSIYYQPGISDLINNHLNNSQLEKLIKCLINEVGVEINDISRESLTESEITQFLIKERFKKTLEELLKNNDLEIVGEIQQMIADYNIDAHVSGNEKEMYKEFDRILEKEGIKFKKEYKLGKRFYYTKKPMVDGLVKTYYEDYLWIYKLYYQDNWNAEFEYEYETFRNVKLESMFNEWANSEYFTYTLDPYYSDYGDVDYKSLNAEIDLLLSGCLNEN